ncbi:MAG TPA: aminopeptidase P family protein [Terracidiphilus sp.]|nr:aminopeptidase P family protein [Terracidiphilus sp.]
MDHLRRMGALRRRLTRAGLSGLLVTHLPDLRYLCGFTGSSAALAVTRRSTRLFTDGRYIAQAAAEVEAAQVEIVTRSPAIAGVQWLAAQSGAQFAGFDPAWTSVADLQRWKAALPASMRRSFLTALAAPLVEPLRLVKDEDELRVMSEAALLGCRLFDHMLGFLRPGLQELEVAAELEHQARLLGAEGMSFDTIVASGARSALPHGRATSARLPKRGFLTLDFGIIHDGYCSDMTRTVYFGAPRPDERSAYHAVWEAQEAGVAAVSAGVACGDVDEAARGVLRRAGLGEAFSHSTGHGVGLEIHESPRIGAGQTTRLQPGMVVTIEPGIYLEGSFGIRIEDMVAVTRNGGQVLTPAPKALIEL